MKKEYYSISDIREMDRHAIEDLGISGEQLMENAGGAVADYIIKNYPEENFHNVLILCGKGNNGGDGFVVARKLADVGYSLVVVLVGDKKEVKGDALLNMNRWLEIGEIKSYSKGLVDGSNIIVDALFGTGFKGDVCEPYLSVIGDVNTLQNVPIVSVDIPSGMNGDIFPEHDDYVRSDVTLTFVAKKLVMRDERFSGEIIVVDIGVPITSF
ncbi:NAD(P)H-hydrate epimerase [Candidatus Margulisiibacteriota bacterium]